MNTPEDMKRKMLESASSDGPGFLEYFRNKSTPDQAIANVRNIGGDISEMAKNTQGDLPTPIGMIGSVGKKALPVITKEFKQAFMDKALPGAIRVIEDGKRVPVAEFAKMNPTSFVPTKSKNEYLSSIKNMLNKGSITQEKANELVNAVDKLVK